MEVKNETAETSAGNPVVFEGLIGKPCLPSSLIWNSPSRDSSGSMPLGNGDIGLNVWVEADGDLLFYVSKTDAWDENGRLLKLGRIRVSLSPNPFVAGATFRQELDLANGCVRIQSATTNLKSAILVWVDANRPVVRVDVESAEPVAVTAAVEIWRTEERVLEGPEACGVGGLRSTADREKSFPDTVLPAPDDTVVWCHRNRASCWAATLEHQHMGDWVKQGRDPLLNRTFGALMRGEGLVKDGQRGLRTATPRKRVVLSIHPLTAQPETLEAWAAAVTAQTTASDLVPLPEAFAAHIAWWQSFWERSWIHVTGTPEAEIVSRGYALQRFITACAGRGAFPIKFNGSIFTVDAREGSRDGYGGENLDADYRRWGGGYWFQNTRLAYWPMIMAGDFDLLEPWFRMYLDALPFATARAKACFGIDAAAMFPETMAFWGAYRNHDYGFDRNDLAPGLSQNLYIRRYWQGMLELLAVLLDAYATIATPCADATPASCEDPTGSGGGAASTVDATPSSRAVALLDTLLELAPPFLRFYRDYFSQRDEQGKLLIKPSQSLETWHEAVNPLPDIVGLHWVLDGLLALPEACVPSALRDEWAALRAILPPLPTRTFPGKRKRLIPALQYDHCDNCENPELYAVFPYRLYGVGKPEIEVARSAFGERLFKRTGGWHQDAVQAALLGLTEEAKRHVVSNFSTPHAGSRFPAFWGPNYDWIPDQDHGGAACIALQRMLMQCDGVDANCNVDATPSSRISESGEGAASTGGAIRLLPAWPKEWDVDFRLHAPGGTVVDGHVKQGVLRAFHISPQARRRAVVVNDYNAPVSWRVSDVFPRPAGGVARVDATVSVDATLPSRKSPTESGGGAASTESWRIVTPDACGFVNLHDCCGGQNGLVYLANRFTAPFAGRWELAIGYDGGIRLFVDGRAVLTAAEARNPARPGRSVVALDLAEGAHDVVIAFDLAAGNGWGIFAEWRVPEGEQTDAVQRLVPWVSGGAT